ncbi:sulfatase [Planctomyces sp. SH-PL62]|uniref:sulfatase family protein n=1 Tax=Planctomyces sp. SH-PL62 TaxID=1636152 RepID=UPI00078B2FA7|nr:sulfatase [Planctomyces sp. SH-PL62]AMV38334.1 Choline-sulfatase [Planctomyces sp. SH-PL62]
MNLPALLTLSMAVVASASEAKPPNIVVFLVDDMNLSSCSPYGAVGRDVETPAMERLARDGMMLTHAFVASPSCAPSRAALLTGLDPMRNGSMLNHSRPKPGVKLWPAYFRDLGYETAAIGKTAHYAQVTTFGFDHASHYTYHDDACVEAAVGWLAKRRSPAPLCLIVGTNWPHVPWPRRSAVPPEDVALPPTLVDTPATRRAVSHYAAAVANADRDLGLLYDAAREHLGPDTVFVFTSDHGAQLPFGKWDVYDAGVRTPLIVVWPGRIQPGSRSDAMASWIDLLPTCLEIAGATPPEGLSGRSFLGVLTGKDDHLRDEVFLTHSGDGAMNRYPLRGVRTRDWKYIRNLDAEAEHHTHIDKGVAGDGRDLWDSWVARAADDAGAAATVSRYLRRPAEELYDLKSDPFELRNLAADADHAENRAQLREKLDRWMESQGDRGLETERSLSVSPAKARASR